MSVIRDKILFTPKLIVLSKQSSNNFLKRWKFHMMNYGCISIRNTGDSLNFKAGHIIWATVVTLAGRFVDNHPY